MVVQDMDFIFMERGCSTAVKSWLLEQFNHTVFLFKNREIRAKKGKGPKLTLYKIRANNVSRLPSESVRVFVVRDLANMTAAFMTFKSDKVRYDYKEYFVRYWTRVAESALGRGVWSGEHNILINVTDWFTSHDYRVGIVEQFASLGYKMNNCPDKGLKEFYSPCSSFNDWDQHKDATTLPILDRWKQVDQTELRRYWTPEAIALNDEIFGWTP